MNKVVNLFPEVKSDPDSLLEHAKDQYKEVLVIGWDKNGSLSARCTSNFKTEEMVYMIELFKNNLLTAQMTEET